MNIVVTWPKSRTLEDYLAQLMRARDAGETAFFKVSGTPGGIEEGDRCYHIHDGAVRGFLPIIGVVKFDGDAPTDEVTGEQFAPGIYVARRPDWTWVHPHPMKGFQGFRYWKLNDPVTDRRN